jgi:hypothetical protein
LQRKPAQISATRSPSVKATECVNQGDSDIFLRNEHHPPASRNGFVTCGEQSDTKGRSPSSRSPTYEYVRIVGCFPGGQP